MTQTLDESTAILWGSADRSLTWVVLSRKHGATVVAKVTADHLMIRDYFLTLQISANMDTIPKRVLEAWRQLRYGRDLTDWATHHLEAPDMRDIVPNEAVEEPALFEDTR